MSGRPVGAAAFVGRRKAPVLGTALAESRRPLAKIQMMPPMTRSLVFALAISSAGAGAQPLDLRITSQGCDVWISDGGPSQSVPPNTDVSNGFQISAQHWRGSSVTSTLAVSRAPDAYVVRLDGVSTYYAAASVRPFFATSLRLTLTAPRPARIDLDARWVLAAGAWQFGASGVLVVGGQVLTQAGGQYQGGGSTSIVVGPTPIVLDLSSHSWLAAPADLRWTLRFTPSTAPVCPVTRYGTGCGAEVAVGEDLTEPGWPFVDLTVGGQPHPGVLAVGLQRQAIPLGPCVLRNEALVILPATGRIRFEPPAVPGFAFKLQGAALANGQLVMSDGLDLLCR